MGAAASKFVLLIGCAVSWLASLASTILTIDAETTI
jgi:hypothetical protein